MKFSFKYFHLLVLVPFLIISSCDNDDEGSGSTVDNTGVTEGSLSGTVFFGQTHVRKPNSEGFKLTSGKASLIKVNMDTDSGEDAPVVTAIVTLGGTSETLTLSGPSTLSDPIDLDLGEIEHTFDNSFTTVIPAELVQPGLSVVINAGDETIAFDTLNIGAPNKIIMNMFDIHFFEFDEGDYPTGWQEEMIDKLPVSEIELRRLPNIVFSELTVPPRANVTAARVSSTGEYQTITGLSFDGEQATAQQWNFALKRAAGISGRYSLFYTNIYGVFSGGQAGGYAGVGNGNNIGILFHELGHALSLPHWGDRAEYPYKGDMFGIPAPDSFNETHAGPIWGYDLTKNLFIPSTIQTNSVGGEVGTFKRDPMQGGGSGDQEEGFIMRHFSDYSINQIQNYLEGHIVVSNGSTDEYASWDATTNSYSNTIANNGVKFAVEKDVEVISVMAGVSAVTPQATILYPPVGPYTSGLINIFDPTNETDRTTAASIYCPNGGCDVSVRIVQGGVTKLFMLPIAMDTTQDPLDPDSFLTRAVNLRASDGAVTSIDLLNTPDAEINGMSNNPQVLYSWED